MSQAGPTRTMNALVATSYLGVQLRDMVQRLVGGGCLNSHGSKGCKMAKRPLGTLSCAIVEEESDTWASKSLMFASSKEV